MKNHKIISIVGMTAVIIGIAGLSPSLYYWYRDRQIRANVTSVQVQAQPLPSPEKKIIAGKPVKLSIPSLSINLDVAEGLYNQNTHEWTLSSDKAHYAEITPEANDYAGNTLIYGHYRREVFSGLKDIKPGAKVYVITDNGYKFTYKYRDSKVTDPTDVSLFNYSGKPILTLQTCEGTWYQNRQLFTLDFARVERL